MTAKSDNIDLGSWSSEDMRDLLEKLLSEMADDDIDYILDDYYL